MTHETILHTLPYELHNSHDSELHFFKTQKQAKDTPSFQIKKQTKNWLNVKVWVNPAWATSHL